MSSTALNWAKSVTIGGANRKAILLILADYCDEEWSCFPSQSRIAEEAEVGERTVRRILSEWEVEGVIRRQRRPSKDGSGRSSDRIYIQPASVAARKPPCEKFQAANEVFQAANGDISTGQGLAGEPPVEPPVENLSLTLVDKSGQPNDIASDFREWYETYPLKRSPKDAERAYIKARKEASRDDLLLGARMYSRLTAGRKKAARPDERVYIKHPATWLNKGCWMEDLDDDIKDVEQRRNPFEGPEQRFG